MQAPKRLTRTDTAEPGTLATSRAELSIVIVSWNTRDLLIDCLHSLFDGGMDGIGQTEVWVVDNASCDGSAASVRELFPEVHLIQNDANVGFARANNQAMDRASGRYQLLLNPDTVIPPNAVARLIEVLEGHSDAAVCSPLLLNADGTAQLCWARFPDWNSEISGRLDRSQSPYPLADFGDPNRRVTMEPFEADWVGGACFVVRADAALRAGAPRLDEAFFMYGEETDWCARLARAGAKTLLVPAVTVTHLGGQSSGRVPAATRWRAYRSSLLLYRRLYGRIGSIPAALAATARFLVSCIKSGTRGSVKEAHG